MAAEEAALSRDEILERLRQAMPMLRDSFHVTSIAIFGSRARGSARFGSDVDLLVGLQGPVGWEIVDLHQYLEQLLGTEVDLLTEGAVSRNACLREAITKDLVYA